jgi:hypothetical protein
MIQDKYIKIANKIGQYPSDKWLHFIGGSYFSQLATLYVNQYSADVLLSPTIAVFGTAVLALLKELFDVKVIKEECQWSDITFTVGGAIIGAAVALAFLI